MPFPISIRNKKWNRNSFYKVAISIAMKEPKKGKKSFSDDLELVFHQTLFEDNLHDNPAMLLQKEKEKATTKTTKKTAVATAESSLKEEENTAKTSKSSRKSFSDNIDLFFKESIEDVLEGTTVTEIKRNVIRDSGRKAIGIDVLLQRTAATTPDFDEASIEPMTKRVTFVIDIQKVEQLKEISRNEKKTLRNIMTELIELYIQQHQEPPPPPAKKTTKKK